MYGVGIIQPGNALRALDALGLAGDAIAQGFPMEGSRFHLADGTMLADLPPPGGGAQYLPMNGMDLGRACTSCSPMRSRRRARMCASA